MKPVKLIMRAFGPYEGEQVVDFAALHGSPLFLIHGPTGAGKSTILDALCFALYGEASGSERTARDFRSQRAAPDVLTEVRLDFRIGEKHYRILRRPKQMRPKKRGEGLVEEDARAWLWERAPDLPEEEDGRLLAEKIPDVKARIEQLLGLSAAQFRQVIVLPQGEFRRLLSADSKDRQKILQRLFDTAIFARIEEKLKERARRAEEAIREIDERRRTILAGFDVEDEKALRALLANIEKEIQKLEISIGKEREKHDIASALAQAREEEERARAAFAKAEAGKREAKAACARAERALREAREGGAEIERLDEEARELRALLPAIDEWRDLRTGVAKLAAEVRRIEARHEKTRAAGEEVAAALANLETTLQETRANAARLEEWKLRCERLAERRERLEELRKLRRRKADLRREEDEAERVLQAAREAQTEARKRLDALLREHLSAQAAALAHRLKPGAPCPVCGSREHPAPAHEARDAPAAAALERAEETLRAAEKRVEEARAALHEKQANRANVEGRIAQLAQAAREMEDVAGDPSALESALKEAEAALRKARTAATRLKTLSAEREKKRAALTDKERQVADLDRLLREKRAMLERLSGRLEAAERRVPGKWRAEGAARARLSEIGERLAALRRRLEEAEKGHEEARRALAVAEEMLAGRRRELAAAQSRADKAERRFVEALGGEGFAEPPAPAALTRIVRTLAERLEKAQRMMGELRQRGRDIGRALKRVEDLARRREKVMREQAEIVRLERLASGKAAGKVSLERFVLGALLDEVLQAANERLRVMSRGRYALLRRSEMLDGRRLAGLELDVLDAFSGEARPVQTLSGGEGFLAALGLALGLADVVQAHAGGVRMDALFIDEGFGALDAEALDGAIDALTRLRAPGRMIGIISHVAELRERIPVQIEVVAGPGGSRVSFGG